jgi:3-isopropylmalate/(R)-2-methylmalate dehydratase small subunit
MTPTLYGLAYRVSGTISTDDILPARYKHASTDPEELATHVFEYSEPGLVSRIRTCDVQGIVVGDNTFGIGSSREQAVSALKAAGVIAVLAPAFGRIFFRNSWNLGVPAITLATDIVENGDQITIDLEHGSCQSGKYTLEFEAIDQKLIEMIEAGGLLAQIAAGGGLPHT